MSSDAASSRAMPLWPSRSGRFGVTSTTRRSSSSGRASRRSVPGAASVVELAESVVLLRRAPSSRAEQSMPSETSPRIFALLDAHRDRPSARQRGTDRSEGVLPPGGDVGRAAHHLARAPRSPSSTVAEPEAVGVGMLADLSHQRHDESRRAPHGAARSRPPARPASPGARYVPRDRAGAAGSASSQRRETFIASSLDRAPS